MYVCMYLSLYIYIYIYIIYIYIYIIYIYIYMIEGRRKHGGAGPLTPIARGADRSCNRAQPPVERLPRLSICPPLLMIIILLPILIIIIINISNSC